MLDIYFASGNPHKVLEINEIAHPYGVNAKLPEGNFDPDETGSTYEENSFIKAYEASKCCGCDDDLFLADDSGLEIYALNNAPGLKSARYAPTAEDRINRVLTELQGVKNRDARFVCAMTLCNKKGEIIFKTTGIMEGKISEKPAGNGGFGYDPIFVPEGYEVSVAEISEDEKNLISHRGCALRKVLEFLEDYKN
ncbi:RdgB/HAM1 family non-canonical purine NTP pyrophosphatase [bacterium]|nr:RdgB/HAM1 family non-canonical purine NTP pyrophosphatase [bacterium]